MAKNLKLSIKNTQLAEALKLGAVKKSVAKKKKSTEEVPSEQEKETPAVVASAEGTAVPSSKTRKKVSASEGKKTTKKEKESSPVPQEMSVQNSEPKPTLSQETPSLSPPPPSKEVHEPREETPTPPPPEEKQIAAHEPEEKKAVAPPAQELPPPSDREERKLGPVPPTQSGYSSYRGREGQGPAPRSPHSSYAPRQPGGSGYPPRREESQGGYSSYPRQQGNYSPRPGNSGYPPRREGQGGYSSYPRQSYSPRPGGGGYPPRRDGQGYPPRQPGGYPPRREGYSPRPGYTSDGSSPPPFRRPAQGFTPGGSYSPRPRPYTPGQGGFSPDSRRPPLNIPRGGPIPSDDGKGERKVNRSFEEETRKAPPKEFREHKPSSKKQEERSFDSRDRYGLRSDEEQEWRKRRPSQKMRFVQQEEVIRPKTLSVRVPIAVKDLAAEMKLKASQLISKLFMKGVVLTLNDLLDDETTIQLLGHDFDCEISIDRTEENRLRITDKTIKQEIQDSPPESLILRPPVVAFMGHVDHGKTSLIDKIRTSNIASEEAGAITQHIGAFKCHTAVGDLTILDTPGHEAFSAMRARGADVTDIVVLVIAGDEGMRTQTLEALQQAQDAHVPVLVALNKSDKPNFNAENIYRQLSEHNLLPEAWGGQTITVNCSALTGEGIKELLEMLALQAEVLELKANPHTRARGSVIESAMHKGLGAVATLLVQNGTLRIGDALVFSQQFARIKTMHDEYDNELTEAGPSTPVKITGLSALPEAGSEFIVVKNEKEAIEIAEKRTEGKKHAQLHQAKRSAESFLAEKAGSVKKKVLNLILRADVQGSVEALKNSLLKITSDKIDLRIVSAAVGEISESDVQLASASKATILGFHTRVESHAETLIKILKVTVKLHDIIYHAVDDIRDLMRSMLDKIEQETDVGSAEVKATFKASQLGVIAGCSILDGTIKRSSLIRQMRDNKMIWKGPIQSLKRAKEDVREVTKGYECGIVLPNHNDIKVGDILQAFEITYLEQEL